MGKNEIGAAIRIARGLLGFGLREFAKSIDVSPGYMSSLERGKTVAPSEETIQRIAEALRRDTDEFMALARRIPSDVKEIIKNDPQRMYQLIRDSVKDDIR